MEQILACWGWYITRAFVSTHLKNVRSDSAKMTSKIINTLVTKYWKKVLSCYAVLCYLLQSQLYPAKISEKISTVQEKGSMAIFIEPKFNV